MRPCELRDFVSAVVHRRPCVVGIKARSQKGVGSERFCACSKLVITFPGWKAPNSHHRHLVETGKMWLKTEDCSPPPCCCVKIFYSDSPVLKTPRPLTSLCRPPGGVLPIMAYKGGAPPERGTFFSYQCRIQTLGGGGVRSSRPLNTGRGRSPPPKKNKNFSALWASVWSKNTIGAGPLPWIRHWF